MDRNAVLRHLPLGRIHVVQRPLVEIHALHPETKIRVLVGVPRVIHSPDPIRVVLHGLVDPLDQRAEGVIGGVDAVQQGRIVQRRDRPVVQWLHEVDLGVRLHGLMIPMIPMIPIRSIDRYVVRTCHGTRYSVFRPSRRVYVWTNVLPCA